jgi:hypothetical protein
MHLIQITAFAAAMLVAGSSTILGSPPVGNQAAGRFIMQPVEGGLMRLDTHSGEVSLCTRKPAGFACEAVPDARGSESEISRLATENRELREKITRLEDQLAAAPSGKRQPKLELPSEADVDKALDYFERMVKKFRDRMKSIEGDTGKGTPL